MAKRSSKPRVRRKQTTKKRASRRAGTSATHSLPTQELAAELQRRQSEARKLLRRRDRLREQMDEVDAAISGLDPLLLGGQVTTSGRPRNVQTLTDALAGVLDGAELTVTEAAEAVQNAGYRTSSVNFRSIVNQTLLREKQFKKVSRGVYTLR